MRPDSARKRAIFILGALGGDDHAVTVALHRALDLGQELFPVKGDFRKQDDVGRVALAFGSQARRSGNPARVAAHDFQNEYLGGGLAHGGDVHGRLPGRNSNVLGHRAKAGAVVGKRQVVVDGLGYVDGLQGIAHGLAELRYLQAGVGRIAATVIEEVADVVGLENFYQALVLGPVLLQALQFVAAGAEGAGGGGEQAVNGGLALLAGVYQVLAQCTDDAVATGIDLADPVACSWQRFRSRRRQRH